MLGTSVAHCGHGPCGDRPGYFGATAVKGGADVHFCYCARRICRRCASAASAVEGVARRARSCLPELGRTLTDASRPSASRHRSHGDVGFDTPAGTPAIAAGSRSPIMLAPRPASSRSTTWAAEGRHAAADLRRQGAAWAASPLSATKYRLGTGARADSVRCNGWCSANTTAVDRRASMVLRGCKRGGINAEISVERPPLDLARNTSYWLRCEPTASDDHRADPRAPLARELPARSSRREVVAVGARMASRCPRTMPSSACPILNDRRRHRKWRRCSTIARAASRSKCRRSLSGSECASAAPRRADAA